MSDAQIDELFKAVEEGERVRGVLLNPSKISDERFLKEFPNVIKHPFVPHAFLFKKEEYELGKHPFYDLGAYSIQDPSAMMAPFFLNPNKGMRVLDMCAAPGGKTIALSIMMEGVGSLLANDLSYPRARNLSQNVERMGLKNVAVSSNELCPLAKGYERYFDKIMLDAPCSGSAMFRKMEEAKEDWTYNKVLGCAKTQSELLEAAYQMLKKGGEILYSTCSFSYEEDDGLVLSFLKNHPDMKAVMLPSSDTFLRSEQLPEAIHLLPSLFQGEGQFICLLRKDGSSNKSEDVEAAERKLGKSIYRMKGSLKTDKLNLLRYGYKVSEEGEYCPDHNLAKASSPEGSIPLTPDQFRQYIHGDSFHLEGPDGFQIVSYEGMNAGYVKIVKGTAKNHYPKGLRKTLQ